MDCFVAMLLATTDLLRVFSVFEWRLGVGEGSADAIGLSRRIDTHQAIVIARIAATNQFT